MEKYNYLNKYIIKYNSSDISLGNKFYSLREDEIAQVENELGFTLPSELKDFYREIGYGFLVCSKQENKNKEFYNTNRINSPSMIKEILVNGQESGLISSEAFDLIEPGDIPFFEISDSANFLVMKANSKFENSVWSDCGVLIEESFERFIWKLYNTDPEYYYNVIQKHYNIK